jgi:hypothetical protein
VARTKDAVEVPSIGDMGDETFIQHYNLRHLPDIGFRTPIRDDPHSRALASLRAFHERCHMLAPFGYDHVHEESDDD